MNQKYRKTIFCITLALTSLSACLADWGYEDQEFPCRKAEDCLSDYRCDPERWVCVKTSSSAER